MEVVLGLVSLGAVSSDLFHAALPLPPALDLSIPGYEIREPIGVGGMGRVDKAWQMSLQRWVAIKSIPTHDGNGRALETLLKREALATSQLSHPNIVKIFEIGSSETGVFLILEWVDGVSLRDILQSGPVDLETAMDITRQIVAALRHAHQRGIIHRDIKPSNILLNDEGHVWVADFGIASLQAASVVVGTRAEQTLLHAGSAPYMAPERLLGAAQACAREDVYSLAALFYELLMGHPPQGVFPALASRDTALAATDAVLSRALAHSAQSRHADVDSFWQELKISVNDPSHTTLLTAALPANVADEGDAVLVRPFWRLMILGLSFFLFQTGFIGMSAEEQFSFAAGPGTKLYDTAMALTTLNVLFVGCWSIMLYRSWSRCRSSPAAPTLGTVALCYLPIIIGITTIVYLAVSD